MSPSSAHFNQVCDLTICEMALGLMILRRGHLSVDNMVEALRVHGRFTPEPGHVAAVYRSMGVRGLTVANPTDPRRIMMTPMGERLIWSAFAGIVRLIDEGHDHFEASMLWSLSTRRSPDDLDS
jgi:hypothetical protein